MDHDENSTTNHTLPSSGNNSFQLQCYFIIAMSEQHEQTPPPQPHGAPPLLTHPKPLAAQDVASTRMNPINRTKVAASPPYLQCYYPDSSFQICQAYHQSSVAGASNGQSHPSLALMDLSLLLKPSKSNNISIKQTNLIEHMSLPTQKTNTSPKGNKVPHPVSLFLVVGKTCFLLQYPKVLLREN